MNTSAKIDLIKVSIEGIEIRSNSDARAKFNYVLGMIHMCRADRTLSQEDVAMLEDMNYQKYSDSLIYPHNH